MYFILLIDYYCEMSDQDYKININIFVAIDRINSKQPNKKNLLHFNTKKNTKKRFNSVNLKKYQENI